MQTVTIAEAGEHFAQLMEQVEHGQVIQITDGEWPVGRLMPVGVKLSAYTRIGFLKGQGHVPPNWRELDSAEDEAGL